MDHEYIEQAARAERLARYVTDKMTVERLLAYAAECRAKIRDNRRPEVARGVHPPELPRLLPL